MFKYYIKVIIRNLLKVFWILPIDKKKIYFQSFGGKSMNCNPWYIFKYMYEKYPDYKYVWLLNKEPEERLKGVIYVKKNTLKWVKEILTSQVLITNDDLYIHVPYKTQQILINTWHGGGAYKRVDSSTCLNITTVHYKGLNYIAQNLDYYISSSMKFTDVMTWSVYVDYAKFLPIGMPRNDVFFHKTIVDKNRKQVCQKCELHEDNFIVLYAPTYRGSTVTANFDNELDILNLKQTLKDKYGKKIIVLFRGHHTFKNKFFSSFDKDVSDYPDTQELLCSADMLITDYSSIMWDYSFL
jgi:CDP-glycerol glycerophosphotransferase